MYRIEVIDSNAIAFQQNAVSQANQKIVFRRKLADEIKPGHSIVMEGTVEDAANR